MKPHEKGKMCFPSGISYGMKKGSQGKERNIQSLPIKQAQEEASPKWCSRSRKAREVRKSVISLQESWTSEVQLHGIFILEEFLQGYVIYWSKCLNSFYFLVIGYWIWSHLCNDFHMTRSMRLRDSETFLMMGNRERDSKDIWYIFNFEQ